jgi:tRNA pseudouridine32 synthase/23S rRNA pseudouridine746 synthase
LISMTFHPLITDMERPERLNNPFYYEPHPLCIMAAEEVKCAISAHMEWADEVRKGKMFGVLVVTNDVGQLGYLAAYSGQIGGRSDWDGFVPAVFDYLQPDGYFKIHESEISNINAEIALRENDATLLTLKKDLNNLKTAAEKAIEDYKTKMREAKAARDEARQKGAKDDAQLIAESQFMKAELRRMKKRFNVEMTSLSNSIDAMDADIEVLKHERKAKSDALQRWLFSHFIMINAKGESRNVFDIFAETPLMVPPSGTGECCAPKLLQYAYLNDMRPLTMAEFWWGDSPKTEIRHHLNFYPACQGKCKPLLNFMLQGIDVEPNPLEAHDNRSPVILYEDDALLVVNKPAGMLSVPGKSNRESVYSFVKSRCTDAEGPLIVHRLDMQTSGLMIVAKTKEAHERLQRQFKNHEIRKRYVAILDGVPATTADKGTISLPLSADYLNRPRQIVDREKGKEAVTDYDICSREDNQPRVNLYPRTGRTHQLRVHCAHSEGLAVPIKGDDLYGTHSTRLFLHAEEITFLHPETNQTMHFISPADF